MSSHRLLTEEEIRAVYRETGGWQADGPEPDGEDGELYAVIDDELDTVCEGVAGRRTARLIAAAPDLAHTALEAMRELSALRPLVVDAIRRYGCAGPGCQRAASSMGVDGETYCTTHAPTKSVRVVP